MRSLRDRQALTIQPRKYQSEAIMTRILSKLIRIQLCAKSFILQVYDVLARHSLVVPAHGIRVIMANRSF
jgi:hypothetical protein